MTDTAHATAQVAVEEEDEDVLTFSTDASECGEPEPDTATTQPPAEVTKDAPSVYEQRPAEAAEPETSAAAVSDECQNAPPALQQPSCAAIDDQEAIKRRQARFGIETAKPAAGVRQGGVAKRAGNAFAGAKQSIAFPQASGQASGPARGRGFVGQRGRGVGSFRGRGGGPIMMGHTGGSNVAFGPPDPSIRAPRPPLHPPPMRSGGSLQPDMMGNAFANLKHNSAKHRPSPVAEQRMAAKVAQVQSIPFTPTATPFRPHMPSAQNGARGSFGVGMGQMCMLAETQVAKASTWVRSEAPPQPAQQAAGFANRANPLVPHGPTAPAENKAVATASTWINPKLKQAGGPSATVGGSTMSNAFSAKKQVAGVSSSVGGSDKDAEITALKARLEELERASKRKAEDGGGEGASVKRQQQMCSEEPASEAAPAGNGRSGNNGPRLGILERLQFGSQRNGAASNGGAGSDARECDREQRGHRPEARQRQQPHGESPPRQERRRRQPEPASATKVDLSATRRRMDRFAARG